MTQMQTYEPIPSVITSVTDVRRALAQIERAAREGDFERAHSYEDAMMVAVLEGIAASNAQAGWLAAEALKSRDIDFIRVCA